jgi:hypothetical protein
MRKASGLNGSEASTQKNIQKIQKILRKGVDFLSPMWYNIYVRRGRKPLRKEVRKMEMTENQTVRLIEWLKENGHTDEQIVECLTYINKKG